MSEPFLAEIRLFGFNFAPRGWAFCDGQLLPINQNQSLYSLLGTLYGGDGRTTFALPDLRGRTPIHTKRESGAPVYEPGQKGGEESHRLTVNEMPNHAHAAMASTKTADQAGPEGHVLAGALNLYTPAASSPPRQPISASTVTHAGGGQPHDTMQPYIAVNFCIALRGLFPSRN